MRAKIIIIDDNNKELEEKTIYPLQEYKDEYGILYNFAFGYRQSESDVISNSEENHHKCEAEHKTCETCGYKGEKYISCACLSCCKYNHKHLEWKPKESEIRNEN